jgi:hypothetical protein
MADPSIARTFEVLEGEPGALVALVKLLGAFVGLAAMACRPPV